MERAGTESNQEKEKKKKRDGEREKDYTWEVTVDSS